MTASGIPGDDYDPCAAYIELRNARTAILMGKGIKRVRFHNGEEQRETEFSTANIADLERAMQVAKDECMALNGAAPRRRAIGFGRPGTTFTRRGLY